MRRQLVPNHFDLWHKVFLCVAEISFSFVNGNHCPGLKLCFELNANMPNAYGFHSSQLRMSTAEVNGYPVIVLEVFVSVEWKSWPAVGTTYNSGLHQICYESLSRDQECLYQIACQSISGYHDMSLWNRQADPLTSPSEDATRLCG